MAFNGRSFGNNSGFPSQFPNLQGLSNFQTPGNNQNQFSQFPQFAQFGGQFGQSQAQPSQISFQPSQMPASYQGMNFANFPGFSQGSGGQNYGGNFGQGF